MVISKLRTGAGNHSGILTKRTEYSHLFTECVLLMPYATRMLNWMMGFVFDFLSIKYVSGTRRKMFMMLISLLPMSAHQAISQSSDGMLQMLFKIGRKVIPWNRWVGVVIIFVGVYVAVFK